MRAVWHHILLHAWVVFIRIRDSSSRPRIVAAIDEQHLTLILVTIVLDEVEETLHQLSVIILHVIPSVKPLDGLLIVKPCQAVSSSHRGNNLTLWQHAQNK